MGRERPAGELDADAVPVGYAMLGSWADAMPDRESILIRENDRIHWCVQL